MKGISFKSVMGSATILLFLVPGAILRAQSTLNCSLCHSVVHDDWLTSRHANTQGDVAGELAANWAGQSPDSVINGSQAENCVACHGPVSVTTGGGMSEVQVMGHFFTTTNGVYTDSTHATDTANWPHVKCVSCHNVPVDHPANMPALSIFNSTTAQYDPVRNASTLCGKCHGTVRFPDTDHRIFDAWQLSRHGHRGQADVAGELAANWAGQSPDSVINGSQAENCVACHAPTSVKMNGGISEVQVLQHFFTTTGGLFTDSTTVADTLHWPDLACNACHNPHKPGAFSYFNSTTRTYQVMSSSDQLCGQCHGNLRFPDTDHLSYNIATGTGGIGVPTIVTMPGAQCVSCHMHTGDVDGTNSLMYKGHRWSVFIREPDSSTTASCTSCHQGMSADSARANVDQTIAAVAILDSIAAEKVQIADSVLQGSTDTLKLRYLAEANHNLTYAESDESGGFHNNNFIVALLNDAIAKATFIVTGVQADGPRVPASFFISQNYPNPFNPSTSISYGVPKEAMVSLKVFNVLGQEVATLVNEQAKPGTYSVRFDASGLASGIYLVRMQAGSFVDLRKMLLLK